MKYPFRKLTRNRKGGASVAIAVMMAMIVAVYFINNIVVWGQLLSSEDRDRANEKIEIEAIWFQTSINQTKLVVEVLDTGSITAHIVAMYIAPSNKAINTVRYGVAQGIDVYIDPAEVKDIVPVDFTLNPSLDPEVDDFTVTLVTERGNSASKFYTYETSLPYIKEVGELGVFRTNWFYSKYSSEQHPPNASDAFAFPPFPEGFQTDQGEVTDAIMVSKSETFVAFYVEIKNLWNRPCAISSKSFIAFNSLRFVAGKAPYLYIVKGVDYSVPTPEITVPYNDSLQYRVFPEDKMLLIFAAEVSGGSDWKWDTYDLGPDKPDESSGITVSLFYKECDSLGNPVGDLLGQSITTQAVIFLEK